MKLLLDTHVFVWWVSDPQRLSPTVLAAFCDPANQMLISIVSIWEMQIKITRGKLTIGLTLAETIDWMLQEPGFELLSLQLGHVFALDQILTQHGDPFDRLLLAQTLHEGAILVSKDHALLHCNVPVLW